MAASFEWDVAKAATNLAKHGVAFEDAVLVFSDPFSLFELNGTDDGEQRWQATGTALDHLLLVVIHVTREREGTEIIRIISARQAERKEKRSYDKANG